MNVREDLNALPKVDESFGLGFMKVKLCRKVLRLRTPAEGMCAPRAAVATMPGRGRRDRTPMRNMLYEHGEKMLVRVVKRGSTPVGMSAYT